MDLKTEPPLQLRELILNTTEPIVIKNLKIPWKCFEESLSDWSKLFGDDLLAFESATLQGSRSPQWEKCRSTIRMSCKDFVSSNATSSQLLDGKWAALSYRNIDELPEEARERIGFGFCGFPEVEDECTFWLSSNGAHTPCHYDTYGCNVVVQVFGCKKWILLPKDVNLQPTRVPYEESSVYCFENFYSPCGKDISKLETLTNCREVVLKAGEVLVVPRHWWHYVETVETSLSVNAWIPLELDQESQIEECVVKYIMENLGQNLDVLNPNQLPQICNGDETLKILEFLCKERERTENHKFQTRQRHVYQYLSDDELKKIISSLKVEIEPAKILSQSNLSDLLRENSKRLKTDQETKKLKLKEIFLNTICNPHMVEQIKNELLLHLN